ncbi:MAG: hypothetical protein JWP53_301, partial [Conexibacter sp.]|nr:hypothetical protein [Conexibacter sp.]
MPGTPGPLRLHLPFITSRLGHVKLLTYRRPSHAAKSSGMP